MARRGRMELLVHIAAPSTRKNDEYYKAQAKAYLNFSHNAAERTQRSAPSARLPSEPDLDHCISKLEATSQMNDMPVAENRHGTVTKGNSTSKAIQQGEQQVHSEDINRARSLAENQQASHSQNYFSCHSDPSQERSRKRRKVMSMAESLSGSHMSMELYVPRALEEQEQHTVSREQPSIARTERDEQQPPRTPEADSMNSLLPSNYGVSETTTDTDISSQPIAPRPPLGAWSRLDNTNLARAQQEHIHVDPLDETASIAAAAHVADEEVLHRADDVISEGPRPSPTRQPLRDIPHNASQPDATPASPVRSKHVAVSSPSNTKHPENDDGNEPVQPPDHQRTSHPGTQPRSPSKQRDHTANDKATTTPPPSLSRLPLYARPPPPSSTSQPQSQDHTTYPPPPPPKLLALASNTLLSARYDACVTTVTPTSVDPAERGRWEWEWDSNNDPPSSRGKTTPWPEHDRARFWQQLCNLVSNGSLGWGVWCTRSEAASEASVRGASASESSRAATHTASADRDEDGGVVVKEKVKVFCFASHARHVWLLLYALSGNRVRSVELRWVGVGGRVVLRAAARGSALPAIAGSAGSDGEMGGGRGGGEGRVAPRLAAGDVTQGYREVCSAGFESSALL